MRLSLEKVIRMRNSLILCIYKALMDIYTCRVSGHFCSAGHRQKDWNFTSTSIALCLWNSFSIL